MITRKRLTLGFVIAVLFVLAVTAGVYYVVQKRILDRAEQSVENLILSQRGLHHYIQRVMHPTFFEAIEHGDVSKTYYTPKIFSSTYIVRTMHGFYNEELVKHGQHEIYYKLAAKNPRNPVNKANQHELALLERFNKDRTLQSHREILTIDGKKYLYYAIPFLENSQACLRCHGKREDAPPGLLALYPGEGGFNEKLGEIRAIESIRAPLSGEYETIFIILAAVGSAALALLVLFWFNKRLRSEVETKTDSLQRELLARTAAENELRIQATLLEDEIAERQKTQEALHTAKEMAESANKAKSLFLANMSHELRTPLNGVVGMAQLLAMTEVNQEQKEYLEALQYSADNLLALISDILDITKIEAEQFQIYHAEYSLRSCFDEVVMMQQTAIHQKGLLLEQDIPDTVPDTIVGDRLRVMQVLSNLLSNAVKFTEQGGIKLSVTVKEQHGSTLLLDMAITDTGIGIAPEKIGYIFSAFTQADETFTRRFGGAGLGLALSRKLAELMGGSITVESTPGKGSTFHLQLPCTVPSRPNGKLCGSSEVCAEPALRPLSVLVAEDNPANSAYAQKLLKALGHQVVLATDGKQALDAWERGAFDLILMDVQMPVMNGDEVVRLIRQQEVDKRIPIIAVTAHALVGDHERLLEAGCDGYVAKPFKIEKLADEIKRVMTDTSG
jgi:signal transduction histidine kinase/ActR/RegA family two-component response regulator